jgi:hypothetical protein
MVKYSRCKFAGFELRISRQQKILVSAAAAAPFVKEDRPHSTYRSNRSLSTLPLDRLLDMFPRV